MLALQSSVIEHTAARQIWVTGVAYFAVVIAISTYAARRTRTARDFFVAGRGIGVWAAGLSAMAAAISGFSFIGGPALVYARGMGAMYIVLPAAITGAMSAWVLAKRMRLLSEFRNAITVPDAIGLRYRSRTAQGLAGAGILIAVVGYMATNVLALGIVINAIFGTGLTAGIWIGASITLAYSASGGILAGVYNDVFQGALMAIASVLVFTFTMKAGGGMAGISRTILAHDASLLGPFGAMSPMSALSLFFVFSLGVLGQPHVIHKYYMVRDPRQLRWMPMVTTVAILMTVLLYYGVGMTMRAVTMQNAAVQVATPDAVTPVFLLHYTPLLLAGIVFAGVAAAIMSTVNSLVNIGAAVFAYDFPKAFGREPQNTLARGRAWTIIITVAAALTAQLSNTVVIFLGIFGWGMFTSTIVPSLAVGLNWRGATRTGAIASISAGIILTLVLESLPRWSSRALPAGVSATGLSFALSMLVFIVVSMFTRNGAEPLDPIVDLVMDA